MSSQNKTIRIVDQGISCDSRFLLIGLGKASVDHQYLTAAFNGIFTIFRFYWHMSVDNVTVLSLKSKFSENHIRCFFILKIPVIGVLFFCVALPVS